MYLELKSRYVSEIGNNNERTEHFYRSMKHPIYAGIGGILSHEMAPPNAPRLIPITS